MANTSSSQQPTKEPVIEIAKVEDAPVIKAIVDAAYSKYIELMGMVPAPMRADYEKVIERQEVYTLREGGGVVGSIVIGRDGDALTINNLVVAPSMQGRGFGRRMMKFAEDTAAERDLVAVQLFTNEKMYDNLTLYAKMGFVETGRKIEDGYHRVYFRKNLN